MSLVNTPGEQPVHFPKTEAFQFDDEVAAIFENMAERSIPMYREAHRIHTAILEPALRQPCAVLDVGASTGAFFTAICNRLQLGVGEKPNHIFAMALDNSKPMCDRLSANFPWVKVICADVLKAPPLPLQPNIINMMYVLQFIRPEMKARAIEWVYDALPENGILLLGQKDNIGSGIGSAFQTEYIRFRMGNGYTKEEIDAKTLALRNSMWCSDPRDLREMLRGVGFSLVEETTRWLNFSTLICVK